jgi:glycosyltransferase involved in cell wall biosynthesis
MLANMDKLRIALWHNLPSGGGKRALYEHVRGLIQRGHYVEAWCPPTASQTYLPLSVMIKEHVTPLDQFAERPERYYSARSCHYKDTVFALNAMEKHCRTCLEEIETGRFDVIFANPCLLFRTSPIGRLTNLPSVLYLQEPNRWLFEALPKPFWQLPNSELALRLSKWRWKWRDLQRIWAARLQVTEEVRNAEGFSRILVNSLFSRESVVRAYGTESDVCYLGVDSNRFPPVNGRREPQMISVGFLYFGKGADRALRAIASIPKLQRPRLLWIGNGVEPHYLHDIKRLAEELDVDFVFKSDVDDATLISYLQQSFAMIYTPRLEPFGYAPLEANLCGLPVIGIAEGGVRETIIDGVNGFLTPTEDSERLGNIIKQLMENVAETEDLRRRGRQHVIDTWAIDKATERLEQRLAAVIQQSTGDQHVKGQQ